MTNKDRKSICSLRENVTQALSRVLGVMCRVPKKSAKYGKYEPF